MAFYDYECEIHKVFEAQQSITEEPLTECPLCRQETNTHSPVKKLISLSSFHLVGGSWAKDNYK